MTRATLPAEKVMMAAAEAMKDKDRPKGSKRHLETLAYMARAAHEDSASRSIDVDIKDFDLIRLFYSYKTNGTGG